MKALMNEDTQRRVKEFRKKVKEFSINDKNQFMCDMLRRMSVQGDGTLGRVQVWQFLGLRCCWEAFVNLTGCSKNYLRRLLTAVQAGCQAPQDGRSTRLIREKPGLESAHTFFSWCYDNVAEPLAEGLSKPESSDAEDDEGGQEPAVFDTYSEWILGQGGDGGNPVVMGTTPIKQKEQRWLPPMKLPDLFDQYCFMASGSGGGGGGSGSGGGGSDPCSRSVFSRAWKEWKGTLRVRKSSQHARCADCSRYTRCRLIAKTEAEKMDIQKSYNEHLRAVFADRAASTRMQKASEESTRKGTTLSEEKGTLYITMDGMDQARRRHQPGQQQRLFWGSHEIKPTGKSTMTATTTKTTKQAMYKEQAGRQAHREQQASKQRRRRGTRAPEETPRGAEEGEERYDRTLQEETCRDEARGTWSATAGAATGQGRGLGPRE